MNNRQLVNNAIKIFTGRHKINLISPINNTVTQRSSFTPFVWHDGDRECYQSDYTNPKQATFGRVPYRNFGNHYFEVHPTVPNRRKELTDRFRCKSTLHIYAGAFRLSSVVRKVTPKFLHNSCRWHIVVKLCSNVTTTDSCRVRFSKQLDPNTRTTCEVAKTGTLNYLATTDGQLPSALRRYSPSPTRRFNFQLLMAADLVTWQII